MEAEEPTNVETRDAARQLGVSFREIYELIDAGELPAYKVGRNIKLRQADIDAFQASRQSGD